VHPPHSPARANFTLMTECTPETAVATLCTLWLGHFFWYLPVLPIGWRILQILRQRWRKTTNTAPTTLSEILYKQQDNPLLSMHNYTLLVVSGNDKNKQITLSTQTCINWKKYVNSSVNSEGRDAYSGLYLSIYVIKSPIQLVRQSHENLYGTLIHVWLNRYYQCVKLSVLSRIASLSVFMLKWWKYKDIDSNRSQIVEQLRRNCTKL